MIHYVCKYAPAEIFGGFDIDFEYKNPEIDAIEDEKTNVHRNICGFCRALIQSQYDDNSPLLLTSCCNSIESVNSLFKSEGADVYQINLPFGFSECHVEKYASSIKKLITELENKTQKKFDIEKFKKSFKGEIEAEKRPYIALMGSRAPRDTIEFIKSKSPYKIENLTCTAERNFETPPETDDFDELILWYAKILLNQQSCMRMSTIPDRSKLANDPFLKGIIYTSVNFCDFYGFEYAALKKDNQNRIPMIKIETDYTKQSTEQINTRIEALFETIQIEEKKTNMKDNISRMNFYTAGIDSGSTSTNCVILYGENIIAQSSTPTGTNVQKSADKALEICLEEAKIPKEKLSSIVTTGYGRNMIDGKEGEVTEITCHAKGAYFLNSDIRTIIDIGGQDSKVIHLDENGNVINFAMNDKCAAGTGRFLDMMAMSLNLDIEDMSNLGLKWDKDISISSMCSVFAQSEVVSLIAQGNDVPDIIHGLNESVAKKVISLGGRNKMKSKFMMTGGVARNKGVVKTLEEKIGEEIYIYENPEICGALGAALIAREEYSKI